MTARQRFVSSDKPWYADCPPDWREPALRRFFSIHGGTGFPVHLQGDETSEIPFYKVSDINGPGKYVSQSANYVSQELAAQQGWKLIPANSILMAKIGAALSNNHRKISTVPCLVDNNCQAAFARSSDFDVNFSYYLWLCLDMAWFDNHGVIPAVNVQKLLAIKVPMPPLREQRIIASFLDAKIAEIDSLVEKLKREQDLLKRYRNELIAHTVTRGLDPNAPVRQGGIDWVPEGPAHWRNVSAKALFLRRAEFERDGDVHLTPSQAYGVLPQEEFISVSGIKPTLKLSDSGKMKHVEPGDFIIHLRSFQGGLEYSGYQGKVSAAYTVITPRDERMIDRAYFRWLFKSTLFIKRLASLTNQLRDGQSINFKTFSKTSYLLPPLDEQQEIAHFLNQKTAEIDSTMAGIETQIDLLARYRKQVINEVVTGKTRVGEVA